MATVNVVINLATVVSDTVLLRAQTTSVFKNETGKLVAYRVTSICCVYGSRKVVAESEAMNPFSQAIEVIILRKSRDKLNELILVHQDTTLSRKDNIPSALADHGEREDWIVAPDKLEVIGLRGRACIFVNRRSGDVLLRRDVLG